MLRKNVSKLIAIMGVVLFAGGCDVTTFSKISDNTGNLKRTEVIATQVIDNVKRVIDDTDITGNHYMVYGLKVGDSKDSLVSKLGVPQNKSVKDGITAYQYPKLVFAIIDEKISVIKSKDQEFRTLKDVGIGSTFEEVVNKYKGFSIKGYSENSSLGNLAREVYVIGKTNFVSFGITYKNREPVVESVEVGQEQLSSSFLDKLYDITDTMSWDYSVVRKNLNGKFVINAKTLESAKIGQLTGIKYSLGASTTEIKDTLGNPEEEEYYEGGKYMKYSDCLYFYDETTKTVNNIFTTTKASRDEIINTLGKPTEEDLDEEGVLFIIYKTGDNELSFRKGSNNEQAFRVTISATP
ncbi:DUF4309 domain-containing protein [Paenibacillus sp. LjRoot153]|uniref:DUF4309 domain-containing protein n=1 Tax=Paenibacillus sp. LjRoot153 TaxID=3342270 RepID=UPI003ECF722A